MNLKFLIIFSFFACLCLSLAPKSTTKSSHKRTRYYSSSSSNNQKTPYEKEKDALKAALYCNDDKMQKGDVCYCGRISLSCCKSKDKCTGTWTRDCSDKVDDYQCDHQVSLGLAYWQEKQNLEEKIECSNEHYDKNAFCSCGKILKSCCKSKSHCDVGLLTENCDSKLDDAKCSEYLESQTNLTKPKYYKEYYSTFAFSNRIIASNLLLLIIIFIALLF